MRRRSRASSKVATARSRKAQMPKRRNAPVTRGSSSDDGQGAEIARLTRERDEALEQLSEALERQTATSEVLRVISSSSGILEPVFQAMLANAVRLCEAKSGLMCRSEGEALRAVAAPRGAAGFCRGTAAKPRDPTQPGLDPRARVGDEADGPDRRYPRRTGSPRFTVGHDRRATRETRRRAHIHRRADA